MSNPIDPTQQELPDLFSDSNLAKEVQKVDALPKDQADIGAVVENGDFGVEGEINKSIGKNASIGAEGSWMKQAGYKVAALFGWKF